MTQPRSNEQGRRNFLTRMAAGILGTSAVQIGKGASAVSAWTGRETNSVLNQARPADKSEACRNAAVDCGSKLPHSGAAPESAGAEKSVVKK